MGRDGVRVDGMMMIITPMGENCFSGEEEGQKRYYSFYVKHRYACNT